MKEFNVYVYFPASELETRVYANSLEEAIQAVSTNGNDYITGGVSWNDSTGEPVRVLGALELGELK